MISGGGHWLRGGDSCADDETGGKEKASQFRAEVFNIANRPTFLLPIGNAANAAFGQITGAVTSGDLGAQRQFQLALKLVF